GLLSEQLASLLDGRTVPRRLFANEFVQAQRALIETAGNRFLLGKWTVAVCGVVSGQRQIAQTVQPRFLYCFPVATEHRSPFRTKILVLRHNVLNGKVRGIDTLLAEVLKP